jgi:hypothetical protein
VSAVTGTPGVSLGGLRAAGARLAVVWPTAITAIYLTALILPALSANHWDASVFVQFGHPLASWMRLPAGAPVSGDGFDGQIYWLQATDPLLRHPSTLAALVHLFPGYHLQRVAYPGLAWLLAGGSRGALPWSLLAINVAAVLGVTQAFTVYARGRGWNAGWALAVGLTPGLVMPVLRDLSDVLAMACLLGGLMAWQRDRPWWAGGLFAVAALSREPMVLVTTAVAAELAHRGWRQRRVRRAVVAVGRRGWPAIAVPLLAFAGWQLYLHTLATPTAAAAEAPVMPPFNDFVVSVRLALATHSPAAMIWVGLFLAITLWGMGLAVADLRFGVSAAAVAAVLFALTLPVIVFNAEYLSMMRYPAPMFLALLLVGLERRSRATLAACGAMTAMTFLFPVLL